MKRQISKIVILILITIIPFSCKKETTQPKVEMLLKWTTYNTSNSLLASNDVQAIAIDAKSNYWFGTSSGVTKFDSTSWVDSTYGSAPKTTNYWTHTSWITYTTADGLVGNDVIVITIDAQGNLWFGTYANGGGVLKFDGVNWKNYTKYLVNKHVDAIAIDAQGNKWFGTDSGVSKVNELNDTTYTKTNGLACNEVLAIAIDAQGNKWFGTDSGVSKFDGTNWTLYNTSNSHLVNNIVNAIAIDSLGNKWFGTANGVSKFDSTWTTYNTSKGLANNFINTIVIDSQGNIWFGTYGGGASKFDGTNWITYNTANGLASNVVHSIAFDAQGNKWFGTDNGVSKLRD
jgi:ligand-binding sensor domain-containing protein